MTFDLQLLRDAVAQNGAVVRIIITKVAGSAPREAGTAMLVWAGGQSGTIGGGMLEFQAVAEARRMLTQGTATHAATVPLGPALGQCCGGSVSLVWEYFNQENLPLHFPFARPITAAGDMPATVARRMSKVSAPVLLDGWLIEAQTAPRRPLWIYGAGHVGRALVDVLAPLPDFAITWVDTSADRFPDTLAETVEVVAAADPATLARHAPADADHLILTYSHAMDLDLCHALLGRDFASIGLIGSATKWARFRSRLVALGHRPEQIARIACPIGDPALGKHPQVIAIGVAAALIGHRDRATRGDRRA